MKQLLGFLLLVISIFNLNAQCAVPQAMTDLEINEVKAKLSTGGDLWWDRADAAYFVPKNHPDNAASVFAGGLWIGALDTAGNIKMAAQQYGASVFNHDFRAGPINNLTGKADSAFCVDFDRFWKVNKVDIYNHMADFNDNGVIDDEIPLSVLEWPGRGNPEFFDINGWDLPDQDLAPFEDLNGDGIYNPYDGDFPKIKGEQAVWWVINDEGNGSSHGDSGGLPLGVEVQNMAYACNLPENPHTLTTFYEFTVINKSSEEWIDTYISMWVDSDIGCHRDDYIGCIPQYKMGVAYNADAVDGTSGTACAAGVPTYGTDIPMLGVKLLEGPVNELGLDVGFSSFMYMNRFINSNFNINTAEPSEFNEIYNYMRGLWRDGTPLTLGGSGYDTLSSNNTNYAFPGVPTNDSEWSMCSESTVANDRAMLINSGPLNLSSMSQTTVTYAFISQLSVDYPCPDFETLIQIGEEIEIQCSGFTSTDESDYFIPNISIYPNPMSDFTEIILNNSNDQIEEIYLTDAAGKTIRSYFNLRTKRFILNKENLTDGLYYLKVVLKNNLPQTKKLMIF